MNPRYPSGYTRLPIVHLRPLGHLSRFPEQGGFAFRCSASCLTSPGRLRPLPAPSMAPLPPVGRRGLRFESPLLLTSFGAGGIRTPGTLTSSMVFETISFNRSDTAPVKQPVMGRFTIHYRGSGCKGTLS